MAKKAPGISIQPAQASKPTQSVASTPVLIRPLPNDHIEDLEGRARLFQQASHFQRLADRAKRELEEASAKSPLNSKPPPGGI